MIISAPQIRTMAIAAAAAGLFVATAVVGYFNFGAVLAAMRPVGFGGFLAAVASQLVLYLPLGLAWWMVAPGQPLRRAAVFVWASLMAEAASNLLPFSQVGGVAMASRAAVVGGVPANTAMASNLVDITVEVVAQLVYTLAGVLILVDHLGLGPRRAPLLHLLLAGLALTACVVCGFIVIQTRGLGSIEQLVHRLVPTAGRRAAAISRVVRTAYGRPKRLCAGLGLHLCAWFATSVGAWITLRFMGRPLPMLSVIALESLLFAIRNAAFMAPGALGVQEGAYALLGPLFGLPAEAALALSLLKRARDIAIGVPALLSWQFVEARRPFRRN
jgi:putative membrane protein